MSGHRLERELASIPVPPGSGERAAEAIAADLAGGRRGRGWKLPLLASLGLLLAFSFTAPGQAAVEWVAETIRLEDPEGNGFSLQDGKTLGAGTSPAGHRYEVVAYPVGEAGVCLSLDPPKEEVEARARSFSDSNCVLHDNSASQEFSGGMTSDLTGQPS